jgi:hypothetical protein
MAKTWQCFHWITHNITHKVLSTASRSELNSQLNWLSLNLSLMLRPMVSRPVCFGIYHPSGAYDQIFITVRQLQACCYGALSLTRGRVCSLRMLLALASAVILGSESRGTRDHILLHQILDFPFSHLIRLAGLRWRYSTPPPHGRPTLDCFWTELATNGLAIIAATRTNAQKTQLPPLLRNASVELTMSSLVSQPIDTLAAA